MSKTALILEGGALRTFYTMGVLDALMEAQIDVDYVCGVSGGALCAVSYLSKQKGRTVSLNQAFLDDKRYRGFSRLLHHQSYFNIEFLFSEVVEARFPLDYKTYIESPQQFECVVTNTVSGQAEYHQKPHREAFESIVATASVPYLSKMVPINNHLYLDGGIGDPIPYQRAKDLGYDKIIVVLTQDARYRKKVTSWGEKQLMRLFYHKYPNLRETMLKRSYGYNAVREQIEQDKTNGSVFVVQPQKPVSVSRFEINQKRLGDLYDQGVHETQSQIEAIINFLNS